jgi:hypothetical protein
MFKNRFTPLSPACRDCYEPMKIAKTADLRNAHPGFLQCTLSKNTDHTAPRFRTLKHIWQNKCAAVEQQRLHMYIHTYFRKYIGNTACRSTRTNSVKGRIIIHSVYENCGNVNGKPPPPGPCPPPHNYVNLSNVPLINRATWYTGSQWTFRYSEISRTAKIPRRSEYLRRYSNFIMIILLF